jgi:hypothetical protein
MSNEYLWKYHTIDAYKPVPDNEDWRSCPKCGVRPRAWVFNNGRTAKCLCSGKYDPAPARAESIHSHVNRTGSAAGYNFDALRIAWNQHVETGQNVALPQGQW